MDPLLQYTITLTMMNLGGLLRDAMNSTDGDPLRSTRSHLENRADGRGFSENTHTHMRTSCRARERASVAEPSTVKHGQLVVNMCECDRMPEVQCRRCCAFSRSSVLIDPKIAMGPGGTFTCGNCVNVVVGNDTFSGSFFNIKGYNIVQLLTTRKIYRPATDRRLITCYVAIRARSHT